MSLDLLLYSQRILGNHVGFQPVQRFPGRHAPVGRAGGEHLHHGEALLRDLGFKRVVLARELSIEQIRAIHEAVPDIELEAFVHGALCVSYSGRCFISEVLANRSANRGACAQFCRMAYDLLDGSMNEVLDDNGQPIHQRYLLSLQDLDRSAYLQELIEAGVTTFKIEGRLKDADYVTNITAYYKEKLDRLRLLDRYAVRPTTSVRYSFTPNPEKTFHRGATDYFFARTDTTDGELGHA